MITLLNFGIYTEIQYLPNILIFTRRKVIFRLPGECHQEQSLCLCRQVRSFFSPSKTSSDTVAESIMYQSTFNTCSSFFLPLNSFLDGNWSQCDFVTFSTFSQLKNPFPDHYFSFSFFKDADHQSERVWWKVL